MQEDIIYLESDEEITTVIDKIKNAQTKKLLLVVPRDATLLQSVVNLKLLLKETQNLGKDIGLVTTDKIGRNLASQVGLTVYDSIKDRKPIFQPGLAQTKNDDIIEIDMRSEPNISEVKPKGISVHHFQESRQKLQNSKPLATPWPKTVIRREHNWPKLGKIIWLMMGVVLLLVFFGAYLIYPKVTVTLNVKAEDFQKQEDVQVSSKSSTDASAKIFSGDLIDISKDKEEKFQTTGKKNLGDKATGTITLYNYWDSSPQNIQVGAKFSSSSKTFIAKKTVTIPGTSIKGGNVIPGSTTVDIEAENPGDDYNIKAGRFTIISLAASQQEKIYGQSDKNLSGGFSKEVSVVSQDDYDKAKDQVTKDVSELLLQDLKNQPNGANVIAKAVENQTTNVTSSTNIDQEASEFTLKVNQRLRVMVMDQNLFNQFVMDTLSKEVSDDKMISLGKDDTINTTEVTPKYDDNILNLSLDITAKISSKIDTNKIKKDLLGKNDSGVRNYLNNLSGLDAYDIKYMPSLWFKRIPNYQKSLSVKLEYINSNASNPSPLPSLIESISASPSIIP